MGRTKFVVVGLYGNDWDAITVPVTKQFAEDSLQHLRENGHADQYMMIRSEHWTTYKTLRAALSA